jgi:hypothetical protein
LQQRLTELNHPDHTLITYPNLGHLLYPSSLWKTEAGPVPEYVLADLYAWLEAHSGFTSPASSSVGRVHKSSLNKGYQSIIIGSKENSIDGHKWLNTL